MASDYALGAHRHSAKGLDIYPTPPWATRALLKYVLDLTGKTVWEPADGYGHISEVLIIDGRAKVRRSDISPQLNDIRQHDFLSDVPYYEPQWVVTNPPFANLMPFIERGLAVAKEGVAMLMRGQALHGVARHNLWSEHWGRITFAPFAERVPMEEGCCAPDTSTVTDYMWVVIDKEKPRVPLILIPPCRRELEIPIDYDDAEFIAAVRAEKKRRKAEEEKARMALDKIEELEK